MEAGVPGFYHPCGGVAPTLLRHREFLNIFQNYLLNRGNQKTGFLVPVDAHLPSSIRKFSGRLCLGVPEKPNTQGIPREEVNGTLEK